MTGVLLEYKMVVNMLIREIILLDFSVNHTILIYS